MLCRLILFECDWYSEGGGVGERAQKEAAGWVVEEMGCICKASDVCFRRLLWLQGEVEQKVDFGTFVVYWVLVLLSFILSALVDRRPQFEEVQQDVVCFSTFLCVGRMSCHYITLHHPRPPKKQEDEGKQMRHIHGYTYLHTDIPYMCMIMIYKDALTHTQY